MIALPKTKMTEASECCCWCGEEVEPYHVYYIDRQRICRKCSDEELSRSNSAASIVWACGMGVCVFLALLAAGVAVYGC